MFDILVNSFGGVVVFFGAQLGMFGLDILTDHNEGKEKQLNNIGNEDHKDVWEGVEGLG